MTGLKAAAALLLCLCASARAAVVAPGPRALVLPLGFSALPGPAASVAAAAPPAEVRAAALSGALADFGRTDLKNAAATDVRAAGDSLMTRALDGAAEPATSPDAVPAAAAAAGLAPSAAPRAAPRRTYLLTNPLREPVRLGAAALTVHAAASLGFHLLKSTLAWKATGSLAVGLGVFAFETVTSPLMTVSSAADLGLRYWRRKLAVLRDLALTPGVDKIRVLTFGDIDFFGPLARRKENTGLIFVESAGPLPASVGRYGAPIPLGNVAALRVRLTFVQGDSVGAAAWTPTLKDLLDGASVPRRIVARWREAVKAGRKARPFLKRLFGTAKEKDVRVEGVLIGADGTERALGAIAEGPAAKTLIGLGLFGRLDRARGFIDGDHRPHKIAASGAVVERSGARDGRGFRLKLRRAWRRLTGRLIVVG